MREIDPEDLVESDHECDERCYHRHHDDDLITGVAPRGAGWRGSFGSAEEASRALWRQAGELLGHGAAPKGGKQLIEHSRLYRQLLAEWEEENDARLVLWEAEQAMLRARRRFERRREAAARRQLPRKDTRSPNRPTRVDVHPEAWTVVKQHAVRTGRKVAEVVGLLVAQAELPDAPLPARSREKRFARLFIDDVDWYVVRAHAEGLGIPVGILVGILVENEARRLGWLPEEDR